MARLLRFGLWSILVLLGAGLIGGYLLRARIERMGSHRITTLIAARVAAQTGLQIIAAGTTISYWGHLRVRLDHPLIVRGGQELCRLRELTLVFSYHALLFNHGLPLLAIDLHAPALSLSGMGAGAPLPRPDARMVAQVRAMFRELAGITREIEVRGGQITLTDGRLLAQNVRIGVKRPILRLSPWQIDASVRLQPPDLLPLVAHLALQVETRTEHSSSPLAQGALWLTEARMDGLAFSGVDLTGAIQARSTLVIDAQGQLEGELKTQVAHLLAAGPRLRDTLTINDAWLNDEFRVTPSQIWIHALRIGAGERPAMASAQVLVTPPYADPTVAFNLSLAPVALTSLAELANRVEGLPKGLVRISQLPSAGTLTLDEAAVSVSPRQLRSWTAAQWVHNSRLEISLAGVSLKPQTLRSLPENRLDGQLSLRNGAISLTQAQAQLGQSSFSKLELHADLSRRLRRIAYRMTLGGKLDLDSLFPLVIDNLPSALVAELHPLKALGGQADGSAKVSGQLRDFKLLSPASYAIVVRPYAVRMVLRREPANYEIVGGSVRLSPGRLVVRRMDVAARNGHAIVDAELGGTGPGRQFALEHLDLELHQVMAQDWLPHAVSPKIVALSGPVGGRVSVNRATSGGPFSVAGALTIGPGQVSFGFLRSPITLINAASVVLAQGGLTLTMLGTRFEGAPLDVVVKVPQLGQPEFHIQATAQRLDIAAIKAIRMPWTPPTPPSKDDNRYVVHLIARNASLGRLEMKDLQADFSRGYNKWRVSNMRADALGGQITMEVNGRHSDDWVDVGARLIGVQAAALQSLAGWHQAILTGRVDGQCSLTADTDNDFFQTLAGDFSVQVRDGLLKRFTLLSRMLSLVDISAWLNARVPDPRVAGVPFQSITANFKGSEGLFATDDFLLDGPVMKITAVGKLYLVDSTLDMQVGMRPFQLLDTVFSKIPLIGQRLAASQSGIVAAYFHVTGPVANPKVVPAPITSISKLLIGTLAIPINLIRPGTVR
jgi:hypothetical protein